MQSESFKKSIYTSLLAITCVASSSSAAPPPKATRPAVKSGSANPSTTAAQNSYLTRLRTKLLNNWMLPDGNNRVELSANVATDGTVDAVQVVSTPKFEQAEQNASDSFSKAQPLEPLPTGLQGAKITVVFVSTADAHGDSSSNVTTKMEPVKAATTTTPATPQK